jgi:molybdenum cofactor guanylyltransferase
MFSIAGIILAGGQSSRMGRNKALLPLPGTSTVSETTFVAHQATLLSSLCQEVILVARDQAQADLYAPHLPASIHIVIDVKHDVGPLMGVYSGLAACHTTHTLVTAVDMPSLQPKLVNFLFSEARTAGDKIVMPVVSEIPQVLFAVYPRSILPQIESLLHAGRRGPRFLLDVADVHYIEEVRLRQIDPQLLSFVNVNTPEELASLPGTNDPVI